MDLLPLDKRKITQKAVDVQEFKSIIENEAHLQSQCEEWLTLEKISYLHIPNAAYNLLVKHRYSNLAKKLKGIPDLLIFKKLENGRNECLCIELKTSKGKQSQGQKNVAKHINVVIKRSFEDVQKEVREFFMNETTIKCSKCGSTNIIHPINEPDVIYRCSHCGHERRIGNPNDQWHVYKYNRDTEIEF